MATVERGAGLVDERQGSKPRDPIIGRHAAVDIATERLAVSRREGARPKGPVRDALPVGQQVLEGDRPFRRDGLVERT